MGFLMVTVNMVNHRQKWEYGADKQIWFSHVFTCFHVRYHRFLAGNRFLVSAAQTPYCKDYGLGEDALETACMCTVLTCARVVFGSETIESNQCHWKQHPNVRISVAESEDDPGSTSCINDINGRDGRDGDFCQVSFRGSFGVSLGTVGWSGWSGRSGQPVYTVSIQTVAIQPMQIPIQRPRSNQHPHAPMYILYRTGVRFYTTSHS